MKSIVPDIIVSIIMLGPVSWRQVTVTSPSPAAAACFSIRCWFSITIIER